MQYGITVYDTWLKQIALMMAQRKVEGQVKVLNKNLVYFLSISQQGVSVDIIQRSAVGNFSPQTTPQIWKLKNFMSLFSDVFSFPLHCEYYAIFES